MANILFVGFGGFLVTAFRYLIGLIPTGGESGFPVKTLAINILGAFVISLIAALAAKGAVIDPKLELMLKVGVCGGFTTFSTFAYESADLLQSGRAGMALAYAVISVVFGVLAVFAGQMIVK